MSFRFGAGALIVASLVVVQPARANDAFIEGFIGGIIGGAIANQQPRAPRSSGVSSAQRQENAYVQTALNYFGFPVGNPDGVIGQRTRSAISQMQALLGYPPTGQLSPFEKDFLVNSYNRAQAGGAATLSIIASDPLGPRGLLRRYKDELVAAAAPQPAPVPQPAVAPATQPAVVQTETSVNVVVQSNPDEMEKLQRKYEELADQVGLLQLLVSHQNSLPATEDRDARVVALQERIRFIEVQRVEITSEAQRRYATPIRPVNANVGMTAQRASEVFPRVPYYIPGTKEIGEMWVRPVVTDKGELKYDFGFMDPRAEYGTEREIIEMTPDEVDLAIEAFKKVDGWSAKAQREGLRRIFEKAAVCFPEPQCAERKVGYSSTEVVFALYEDGSTAAKVQRNKGPVAVSFNFSIESSRLLTAYLDFMSDVGEKEFTHQSMTDEKLDAFFE
jgi:hypothetical protein